MFHFTFTKVMEARLPPTILLQIFRCAAGEKDVTGISAIHHALRHINSSAGHIRAVIHIADRIDRSAMHTHPQLNLRVSLQCLANFKRAFHWRFGVV